MPTPNSGIPYVPENTTDPAAGLNESLRVIDALIQAAVLGFETDPPVSPADGDRYIVGTGGTGDWSGQDENMAQYVEEGDFWQFYEAGAQIHIVLYDGEIYAYDAGWEVVAGGSGIPEAPEDGQQYGRQDGDWTVIESALSPELDLVTEAGAFTATVSDHSGRNRLILAGGDITFNTTGISAGQCYNIRSTGALELIGSGVTLTPTDGGTLEMNANMQVTVVMTSGTTAIVMGLTVAA